MHRDLINQTKSNKNQQNHMPFSLATNKINELQTHTPFSLLYAIHESSQVRFSHSQLASEKRPGDNLPKIFLASFSTQMSQWNVLRTF